MNRNDQALNIGTLPKKKKKKKYHEPSMHTASIQEWQLLIQTVVFRRRKKSTFQKS